MVLTFVLKSIHCRKEYFFYRDSNTGFRLLIIVIYNMADIVDLFLTS